MIEAQSIILNVCHQFPDEFKVQKQPLGGVL